jgi:transposase InsO family protein
MPGQPHRSRSLIPHSTTQRKSACRTANIHSRSKGIGQGLAVPHDHGSQYMSDHFQKELTFLGIESSPAFVRAPEGNGCAERFIRTLKVRQSG